MGHKTIFIFRNARLVFSQFLAYALLLFAVSGCSDDFKLPTLHDAALYGDLARIQKFVRRGKDVNQQDRWIHSTPLHWAVLFDHQDVMAFLLEHGAMVNAGDVNAETPLHYAALLGNVSAVECLLRFGADIDRQDKRRMTPLHYAADYDAADVGGYVHLPDFIIRPYLSYYHLEEIVYREIPKKQETVRVLLAAGANPNVNVSPWGTSLDKAVLSGDVVMVSLLLSHGASIKAVEKGELSSLEMAKDMIFHTKKKLSNYLNDTKQRK